METIDKQEGETSVADNTKSYSSPPGNERKKTDLNREYGRIGQKRYSGIFWEEFVPELRGRRGTEVYREMSENDDIIGAVLFAIENLIRQANFDIRPAGNTEADKKAADFIQECMHDMKSTWTDTLSEILSFLTFGWGIHEIIYKRRMGRNKNPALNSKYDDGLIGWQKLPIRAQDTLWQWEYDEMDELTAVSQMAPPDYNIRTIPMDKCLHFKTRSRKDNPEGRSILRNAYRSWFFKRRLQEIEGIGIERDLAGLPMLQPPEGIDIWDDTPEMQRVLAYSEQLVQNVRRDVKEGVVLPAGWTFSLLSSGSRRQFEVGSVIERYDNRMATTVLADFVLLGQKAVGSYALSSDKTELFALAIGTYLDIICEVFNNQAIPRLIDLNAAAFKGITDYPHMEHGDIEKPDVTGMTAFIKEMVGLGIIVPDEQLEDYVRQIGDLPEKLEGAPMPEEYIDTVLEQKQKMSDMNSQRANPLSVWPNSQNNAQDEEKDNGKVNIPPKQENEAEDGKGQQKDGISKYWRRR